LEDMGIGGIWLMPTFPSPLADSGYDVADYKAVHSDYGSLADMQQLIEAAHNHNMLIYLDMVFNHTSDQHNWFQSALTGPQSPYFDYYVWSDSPTTHCVDVPISGPFGNQRWTYVNAVGKYYFHQFLPRQPDLNIRNPTVQEALLSVLDFWLGKGVDGFRFDVPDRYIEQGNRCTFTDETRAFHRRLREEISGTGTLTHGFVGEIWGTQDKVKPFFGPDGNPMIFNFELLFGFYGAVALGGSPRGFSEIVNQTLAGLPAESRWGLVIGNHDTPRFANLAGGDSQRLKLAAAIQLTLPGVPFIWMGDELGLLAGSQVKIDWRDTSRTPYPWTNGPGFGFTAAAVPHLAFSDSGLVDNYQDERADPDSLLNTYRRLINARNGSSALNNGDFTDLRRTDLLWAYQRTSGDEQVTVVHNFSTDSEAEFTVSEPSTDMLTGASVQGPFILKPGTSRLLRRR